jgi:N-hydroxyarylamine O-acetyltransferase
VRDLDTYFDRIGFWGSTAPTVDTLERLLRAHAFTIPFENLAVWLRVPIRLDLASIADKLVARRRGGYCFEHNTWLAAVLARLGYAVTPLAGRIRWQTRDVLPRTHMALLVTLDGRPWLVDGGFGGAGPTGPLRLEEPEAQQQEIDRYRVRTAGDLGEILQVQLGDEWADVYSFTREPQLPADYEMANHFTQTYPHTRMTTISLVTLPFAGGRKILVNHELTIRDRQGRPTTRHVTDDELPSVLAHEFGLRLPEGTRLTVPS